MMMQADQLLRTLFDHAVAAADPALVVPRALPQPPTAPGRTLVLSVGKAAASMAAALEAHWPAHAPLQGIALTRYGHGAPLQRIELIQAGHPMPDNAGHQAALRMLPLVQALTEQDLLVMLVSGGGSSLLAYPVATVPLADLQTVTKQLLAAGTPIDQINVVRKHLSQVQGGWLAAHCKARICTLIISDVPGDDPSAIASGPTVADLSTYADALDILQEWHIQPPISVLVHLRAGARGEVPETPKPGDAAFERCTTQILSTAQGSLQAAAQYAQQVGVRTLVLGDTVAGQARDVAWVHASIARQIALHESHQLPCVILSGGECTVTVRGNGRGGRCTEFLLALKQSVHDLPHVSALACDTDGIDGVEDNAGAYFVASDHAQALRLGLKARDMLHNNDAYHYFKALNRLVMTGPTLTNVNDFRAILIQ